MSKGIKELSEFLWAVGFLAGNVDEAFSDGPGIEDIKSAMDVLKENEKVLNGFKGFKEMGEEVKDIDANEIKDAVLGLLDAYKEGQK